MNAVNRPSIEWYLETHHDIVLPAGRKPSIRCPFHEDRSPSARVDLDGERFTCYSGCFEGRAVDVIDIVMELENLDFLEARERVKGWPGTLVEASDAPATPQQRQRRARRKRSRGYSFGLLER